MKQMQIQGQDIDEYSDRSFDIQNDIEELLALAAAAHRFNWTAPLHDIVRRLMNEVNEFITEQEE